VKTNLASSKRNFPSFRTISRRWEETKENCIRLKRIDDRLIAHLLGSSHEKNDGMEETNDKRRMAKTNEEDADTYLCRRCVCGDRGFFVSHRASSASPPHSIDFAREQKRYIMAEKVWSNKTFAHLREAKTCQCTLSIRPIGRSSV